MMSLPCTGYFFGVCAYRPSILRCFEKADYPWALAHLREVSLQRKNPLSAHGGLDKCGLKVARIECIEMVDEVPGGGYPGARRRDNV
jgi:hypothetical protein